MCEICKTLFPLGVIAIVSFIPKTQSVQPSFTIETISATCVTEINDLDIQAIGNSIVITAPMQTPNPCYSVEGDVKISGNDIEIDLSAVPKQDVCIQCVGEVTGKVVIPNLSKGMYGVDVKTLIEL